MSSIDIAHAIDVGATSDSSSLDSSDSEVEVEVTQVVQQQQQQQQQQEEEGEEDLGLELDESAKISRTCLLPTKPAAGSLKGSSPRPAVQKTIVNFFSLTPPSQGARLKKRKFCLSAFMSCKYIGWQQTARMGGGAGRGNRVGNESTSYRVACNTKG